MHLKPGQINTLAPLFVSAQNTSQALAQLPCDAIQEPTAAAGAARRALASLPSRSPFAAVAPCRRMLEAALRAAEELEVAAFEADGDDDGGGNLNGNGNGASNGVKGTASAKIATATV